MKRFASPALAALLAFAPVAAQAAAPPIPPSAPAAQKQTLGAKLRASYAASVGANVEVNPPWFACLSANNSIASVVCSAWVASASYVYGNVVSNSGHLYIELNTSCVSAASGGPTQTTNVSTADNTCNWSYFGEPRTAANDAAGPTVSVTTGTAPFSGAVYWNIQTYPNLYTLEGLQIQANYGSYYVKTTAFNNFASNPASLGGRICANVTDSKFAFSLSSGSPAMGISIDGRMLSVQPDLYAAGNPSDVIFDFTSTSGFRTRQVCAIGTKTPANSGGFFTTANGNVTPATPPQISAAMVYDSYDAGSSYGPFSGYGLLGQQIGAYMGWSVWDMSQGGTGPQNPNGSYYNYNARVTDTGNASTLSGVNVIVTNSSTNDSSCTGSISGSCPIGSETAAIQNELTSLRADNPTALIVVVGAAPVNASGAYASYVTVETTGAAAVSGWSDPAGAGLTCFIPWSTSTASTPIVGSYQSGVPSGLPAIPYLINSGDSLHPTDLGTYAIAGWLSSQIAKKCLPSVP